MLRVIHSNRIERLVNALIEDCSQPLSDPMQSEIILVQNPGMARWLSQQFALATGIAANLRFPLPASFVWELQQQWLGTSLEQGSYDRASLRWWLMRLIPECIRESGCSRLGDYLQASEQNQALRLYQLAGRIADHFDQYLVYRPELLLSWEASQSGIATADATWQAWLWRALVEANGSRHRASLFEDFLQATRSPPKSALPERVSVFGLSALAPVYLEALHQLSRHAQVHFYLLNPCQEYWADILDERGQARRRARWRASGKTDISSLMDLGNPLLAANGQMAQVLVDQLLELDCQTDELFETPQAPGLLGQLQQDILQLRDRSAARPEQRQRLDGSDNSVQVHGCHSQLREIQVLHDQLRRAFDDCEQLRPHEIVVMAPSISDYRPWIEAIFGSATGERAIPWSIADGSQTETPIYQAIDFLLSLPRSRLEASSIIGLLEVPAVMARFELDQDALERIRIWVSASGIRWGWDGTMRTELGLPEEAANSWDFGLQRLFYGYALPLESGLCQGVLPYGELEGSEVTALGQLAECLQRINEWRKRLAQPATATEWQRRIQQLLDDFFDPRPEEAGLLQNLRHAMADLRQKTEIIGYTNPIELDIIRAELSASLSQQTSAAGFLTGRVTFCNLVPMRGIPFRIICLLGLNEGQFPRHDPSPGFNLMAAKAHLGDRSKRLDDRYLFLEALLCARERLLIFHQSRSQKNNTAMPPSVVLGELLDYISTSYAAADGSDLLPRLLIEHPLQPFSRRYFDGSDPRLFSYDHHWLAAIKQGTQPPSATETAQEPPEQAIEISDLIRFLSNPADWFLRHGLYARSQDDTTLMEDDEPFELDPLTSYGYKSRLLEALLTEEPLDEVRTLARHSGELPPGALGELSLTRLESDMGELAETIRPLIDQPLEPLEIDLNIGRNQLRGWLHDRYTAGLIRWRPSNTKAKDVLDLWVRHLALCLSLGEDTKASSSLVMQDGTLSLQPVTPEVAADHLQQLIELWQRGQQEPLPFFPEAAQVYAQSMGKDGLAEQALDKAEKAWEKDEYGTGPATQSVASLFQGQNPIRASDFAELALRVFEPILEYSAKPEN